MVQRVHEARVGELLEPIIAVTCFDLVPVARDSCAVVAHSVASGKLFSIRGWTIKMSDATVLQADIIAIDNGLRPLSETGRAEVLQPQLRPDVVEFFPAGLVFLVGVI